MQKLLTDTHLPQEKESSVPSLRSKGVNMFSTSLWIKLLLNNLRKCKTKALKITSFASLTTPCWLFFSCSRVLLDSSAFLSIWHIAMFCLGHCVRACNNRSGRDVFQHVLPGHFDRVGVTNYVRRMFIFYVFMFNIKLHVDVQSPKQSGMAWPHLFNLSLKKGTIEMIKILTS